MLHLVSLDNHRFTVFQEDKAVEVLLSFVKLNTEFYRPLLSRFWADRSNPSRQGRAQLGHVAWPWVCPWPSFF